MEGGLGQWEVCVLWVASPTPSLWAWQERRRRSRAARLAPPPRSSLLAPAASARADASLRPAQDGLFVADLYLNAASRCCRRLDARASGGWGVRVGPGLAVAAPTQDTGEACLLRWSWTGLVCARSTPGDARREMPQGAAAAAAADGRRPPHLTMLRATGCSAATSARLGAPLKRPSPQPHARWSAARLHRDPSAAQVVTSHHLSARRRGASCVGALACVHRRRPTRC